MGSVTKSNRPDTAGLVAALCFHTAGVTGSMPHTPASHILSRHLLECGLTGIPECASKYPDSKRGLFLSDKALWQPPVEVLIHLMWRWVIRRSII